MGQSVVGFDKPGSRRCRFRQRMSRNARREASEIRTITIEGKAVSHAYRKHPLSIAISMALLAAATSAMASESTGTPAESAGAQGPAQQDASDAAAKAADDLSEITVVGVR